MQPFRGVNPARAYTTVVVLVYAAKQAYTFHNLTDGQTHSALAIFTYNDTYRPLMKKLFLQNIYHLFQGVSN